MTRILVIIVVAGSFTACASSGVVYTPRPFPMPGGGGGSTAIPAPADPSVRAVRADHLQNEFVGCAGVEGGVDGAL